MASPKMNTTMSYSKAATVFEQDMFWKAVNEIERREIFRDVQGSLKRKRDAGRHSELISQFSVHV